MNETSCGADLRQRINNLLDKITSEEDVERVYKFAKYVYICLLYTSDAADE